MLYPLSYEGEHAEGIPPCTAFTYVVSRLSVRRQRLARCDNPRPVEEEVCIAGCVTVVDRWARQPPRASREDWDASHFDGVSWQYS